MARIRMLRTTPGSPDGYNTVMYTKDMEYDVPHEIPEHLAKTFVMDMKKAAIYVTADTPPIETKAISAAPENAAMEAAPKNKDEEAPKETETEDVPEDKEPEKEDDIGWEPQKKAAKTVRVHELADELGMPSKDIMKVAKKLGIDAKTAFKGLSEEDVEKIKASFKK